MILTTYLVTSTGWRYLPGFLASVVLTTRPPKGPHRPTISITTQGNSGLIDDLSRARAVFPSSSPSSSLTELASGRL
ncbi:hypothetical protein QC761_0042070 [Podospora bellae-mahoneyi]|uniref:Secreted protein n=1 Tax=Podospora bellae-mahoneyi TaxID=2093777 RepID=A0ABR0FQY0_9PEZI|nr:hypothetical protein QC761_0042070 [Podospora bellae-mahoneyi]